MRRSVFRAVGACLLLAACQPATRPNPATASHGPPPARAVHRAHQPKFADGTRSSGNEAQFATNCAWPSRLHSASARRLSSGTVELKTSPDKASDVEAEGCAILRFSLSKAGRVDWIEVVSAKPATIGPLALKCLMAAKFKPDPHPEATSLVRVDVRKLEGDVLVAALKLR